MSTGSEEQLAVTATRKQLTDLNYVNPQRVLEDSVNLLTHYNTLELISAVIERKGANDELIKLSGKITITPPNDQLGISGTITVWIEKNFPVEAPMITFTHTNFPPIYFEPFLNIKQGTIIYSPFYEWKESKSTLLELLENISVHLRQVCLGWILSARDQDYSSCQIPPRLTMPSGFPPMPIPNNPNNTMEISPIGARPPYLNQIPANSIQPTSMAPQNRQPILSPPTPFQIRNEIRNPYPMPNLPNQYPLYRQTTSQELRQPYPYFVLNQFQQSMAMRGPSLPPYVQPQQPLSPPKQQQIVSNMSSPIQHPIQEAQNGYFASPTSSNKNPIIMSPPEVPAFAKKVQTKSS